MNATVTPINWRSAAACRDASPVDMTGRDSFRKESGRNRDARERRALAVCEGCTVRDACLAYAVATNAATGIWGGLTPTELVKYRKELRRAEREAAAAAEQELAS